MSHSTLYGVNDKKEIQEIQTYQNGMLACTPVWDFLERKYFNDALSFSSPETLLPSKKLTLHMLPLYQNKQPFLVASFCSNSLSEYIGWGFFLVG